MFKENLRRLREERNLTVNGLARISGVHATYISALERGEKKNPSMQVLTRLAEALNVDIKDLVGEEEDILGYLEGKEHFKNPEEATQFLLKQPAIMGYGGFDYKKLSPEERVQFANELLNQLKLLGLKYNR